MGLITEIYSKIMNQFNSWRRDERGSQTLEWLGIAAVVIIIVGFISSAFTADGIGEIVRKKFEGFIEKIGG